MLVNGQSGQLVGDAPTSWWKVLGVVLLAVAVVLALMACLGGGSTLAALLAVLAGR
ncbi:MAG: hypothetical protein R3F59_01900 [Myxococcota bacterium]